MIVKNLINEIMPDIWPMALIIMVIIASLRIAYLIGNNKKFIIHKELFGFVFIMYILCLYHVVTFQDINYGTNNFIPFKEMFRYSVGSLKFIKNIIGNILLFVPFGFFSSYYLKAKKISTPFILTLITSLTIEIVQYYIGRVFDIDDIILNVLGGVIGALIYIILDKIRDNLPNPFNKEWFKNLLFIILLIIAIIYFTNGIELINRMV